MPVRTAGTEGGGHQVVCQRERWAPKRVDCEIPHRLETRTNDLDLFAGIEGGGYRAVCQGRH